MSKYNRMKAKKRKERQRARRLEKERLEQLEAEEDALELEAEEALENELTEEDEEDEPEVEEKSYDSVPEMAVAVANTGPTSWEELDMAADAKEKAYQVKKASWDVEDIVYNIINNPVMSPDEKGSKIKAVGEGFSKRVSAIVDTKKEADMDLLSIEAIIAHDNRNIGITEKVMDFITKKKLSSGARKKLPDSSFALPEKRKYPIHDAAHVRNALARAAQQIKKGGEGAADAKKALPKIRAAAKKFGIETSMEKDHNAMIIEKDANGDWRAVMWVSNNFIDRDYDIIAESAHKEYVGWLDANPDMAPAFLSWHIPETVRKNRIDFWAYENGFLIMSAKLEEAEAQRLLKAQAETEIGMSHGTLVFDRDKSDPRTILKYRMYEVSDLPVKNAANPFTDFETIVKEVDMNKLDYLTTILGDEEAAKAFIEKTGAKQKELREAQVEEKEVQGKQDPETEETQEVNVSLPADDIVKALKDELDVDGLAEWVRKASESLEKVPVLEELVKNLMQDTDEKLAEKISPPERLPWSKAASQSKENLIKEEKEEDKKLLDSTPGVPEDYWLSHATNTTPIKETA